MNAVCSYLSLEVFCKAVAFLCAMATRKCLKLKRPFSRTWHLSVLASLPGTLGWIQLCWCRNASSLQKDTSISYPVVFFTLQHEQCTSTLSWIWMYRLNKYSVQSLKQNIKCTGMSISFEEQAFVKILLHKGQKQESFLMVWCVIFLWHIILCLAIMHIVFSLFYIDRRSIPFFFKWPLFTVFFNSAFSKKMHLLSFFIWKHTNVLMTCAAELLAR